MQIDVVVLPHMVHYRYLYTYARLLVLCSEIGCRVYLRERTCHHDLERLQEHTGAPICLDYSNRTLSLPHLLCDCRSRTPKEIEKYVKGSYHVFLRTKFYLEAQAYAGKITLGMDIRAENYLLFVNCSFTHFNFSSNLFFFISRCSLDIICSLQQSIISPCPSWKCPLL